jgi:hypothetical protein
LFFLAPAELLGSLFFSFPSNLLASFDQYPFTVSPDGDGVRCVGPDPTDRVGGHRQDNPRLDY